MCRIYWTSELLTTFSHTCFYNFFFCLHIYIKMIISPIPFNLFKYFHIIFQTVFLFLFWIPHVISFSCLGIFFCYDYLCLTSVLHTFWSTFPYISRLMCSSFFFISFLRLIFLLYLLVHPRWFFFFTIFPFYPFISISIFYLLPFLSFPLIHLYLLVSDTLVEEMMIKVFDP